MRALRVLEYMCIIAGAFMALASIIGSVGGTLQLRSIAIGWERSRPVFWYYAKRSGRLAVRDPPVAQAPRC